MQHIVRRRVACAVRVGEAIAFFRQLLAIGKAALLHYARQFSRLVIEDFELVTRRNFLWLPGGGGNEASIGQSANVLTVTIGVKVGEESSGRNHRCGCGLTTARGLINIDMRRARGGGLGWNLAVAEV